MISQLLSKDLEASYQVSQGSRHMRTLPPEGQGPMSTIKSQVNS